MTALSMTPPTAFRRFKAATFALRAANPALDARDAALRLAALFAIEPNVLGYAAQS